jgi:hypothetical protein
VLDAEAGQRAADLREHVLGDGLPGLRRVEGPARAIAVQRLGNPWVTNTLQSAARIVAVDSAATSWA